MGARRPLRLVAVLYGQHGFRDAPAVGGGLRVEGGRGSAPPPAT